MVLIHSLDRIVEKLPKKRAWSTSLRRFGYIPVNVCMYVCMYVYVCECVCRCNVSVCKWFVRLCVSIYKYMCVCF